MQFSMKTLLVLVTITLPALSIPLDQNSSGRRLAGQVRKVGKRCRVKTAPTVDSSAGNSTDVAGSFFQDHGGWMGDGGHGSDYETGSGTGSGGDDQAIPTTTTTSDDVKLGTSTATEAADGQPTTSEPVQDVAASSAAPPPPPPSDSPSPSPPPPSATTSDSTVGSGSGASTGDADADLFVKLHTDFRAKYGASALTWNTTMAEYAQNAAQTCKYGHTGGPYGENIAAGVGGGYDITSAFNSWANEAADYNWNDPGYQEGTGHFTQIVWKGTSQIGCAKATCGDNTIFDNYNQDSTYVVCEYYTAGNIVGDNNEFFVANVGVQIG